MKLQEKEISAYEAEHQNIAERLMREMPPFKEAERFLELVRLISPSLRAAYSTRR